MHSLIQVEVRRNAGESPSSVVRRFTKKVQGSGILRRARSLRFIERVKSDYVKKKKTLKRIAKRKATETLMKLGKIPDAPRHHSFKSASHS